MFRRKHAIALLLTVPALATLTNGCSSDQKATPQIIFDGRLEGGSDHGAGISCKDVGALFTVGDFGNQAVDPKIPSKSIPDGEAFEQGTVSVTCSVVASGTDEFDVSGSVNLSGATGGLFRMDGKIKTTCPDDNPCKVHVFVSSKRTGNAYESKDENGAVTHDCIVRYTTPVMGVAAGRVWGSIDCPHVRNTGAQTACEAKAEFRFENCAQ